MAAAGAGVYLNTLDNGFALDDVPLVRDDPRIASLSGVPRLLLEPYWRKDGQSAGLYRPLANVSFALNRALLGAEPRGFHLVNALLHGLVSALVWVAARRASTHYGAAFIAGLLFAVHPVHSEAVANIAGRAELLAAAGVLGAWLAHARAREAAAGRRRLSWGGLAGAIYLAAILAKETAVAAPLLFVLDDALHRRDAPRGRRTGGGWAIYGAYAAALVLDLVLRAKALGGFRGAESAIFLDNPAAFEGTVVRLATALWILVRYAGLLLWPARLSSDYSYDAVPVVRSMGDPRFWLGLGFLLLLLAALAVAWRRSRPIALGIAAFPLFFLPSANFFFPAGTLMAERLAYLPSFGGCLLAGQFGAAIARPGARARPTLLRRAAVIALASAATVTLGARTWLRNPVWKDNASLALHDVEVMPRSAKLQAGAGIVLHELGRRDQAEARYRKALEIYPEYAQIHYNLGVLLRDEGRMAEAVEQLVRAAALSPENPRPAHVLTRLVEESAPAEAASLCRRILAEPGLPRGIHEAVRRRLAQVEE